MIKLFCIYIYMNKNNNNINTLTFDNHDTYIYYVDDICQDKQAVYLTPTYPEDKDTVRYVSSEATLFTNGVNNGVIKFNNFSRFILNPKMTISSEIGTIITNDGILMFNSASERNSLGLTTTGLQTKSLATYKSGKYANYINVEIQVDFEDGYRIVTISY
jgi:hypothetical protein